MRYACAKQVSIVSSISFVESNRDSENENVISSHFFSLMDVGVIISTVLPLLSKDEQLLTAA